MVAPAGGMNGRRASVPSRMTRKSLLLTVVVAVASTAVFAQTQQLTGDALVRALLDEVRQLRLAMQKNSAYDIRGRLLLDRAKMHQDNIREISRELEQSNDFMRSPEMSSDITMEETMVEANIEARAATVADPQERQKMLEREKAMMEKRKEMQARHHEQMRMRFQRMEQRLVEEKAKLAEIEDELAKMQAELTR